MATTKYSMSFTPEQQAQLIDTLVSEIALSQAGHHVQTPNGPLRVTPAGPPEFDSRTGKVVKRSASVEGAEVFPRIMDLFPADRVARVIAIYQQAATAACGLLCDQAPSQVSIEQTGSSQAKVVYNDVRDRPVMQVGYARSLGEPARRWR